MGIEIERKFLIKNMGWRSQVVSESQLKQGYLANQNSTAIRVRIVNGTAVLNVKGPLAGIKRAEFEYPIPIEDAEDLLEQVALHPIIEKTRYKIKLGQHLWEVDVFEGVNVGLIMAEIELKSSDEYFEIPSWIGEEVSGNSRYYNVNLISQPFTTWVSE